MYCIDTNIAIEFLRGNKDIIEKINYKQKNNSIFITPITLCELYKGIFLSSKRDYELPILEGFIDSLEILDMNKESCKEFGKEFALLQKTGKTTEELDLMIAAIAKTNNCIIVTRNKKHFENTSTQLEVW